MILRTAAVLITIGAVIVLLFWTKEIKVEGNSYYSENTITSWIQRDRFSKNTLYVLMKYNFMDADLPSGVERMHVSLKNPWTVVVQVKEKELAGYVDYDGAYLYFDREGIAVIRTKKIQRGTPYIEGLPFEEEKVRIGAKLPVEDDSIFDKIVEVSKNLKKNELSPDRISCTDGNIQVSFGGIQVMLGSGNYEEKLQQVPPILEKLKQLYSDPSGILHLEKYDTDTESIRFTPSE